MVKTKSSRIISISMVELIGNNDLKDIKYTYMEIGNEVNLENNFSWMLYIKKKETGCLKFEKNRNLN